MVTSKKKKTFKRTRSIEKISQSDESSGKFRIRSTFVITTYSLEWLNLQRLTIVNIDEDVEQLEFSCSDSRN